MRGRLPSSLTDQTRRPCLVANGAPSRKSPRNVADECELTVITKMCPMSEN